MNRFRREAIITALLPGFVIIFGLIVGLVAPRLYGQSGTRGELSVHARQQLLLSELGSCLRSLPEKGKSTFISPCAERDITLLIGLSRRVVASSLGHPDWCKAGPNAQLLPWSERLCAASPIWDYWFYRLPVEAIGGGPELQFSFDGGQNTVAVSWVHTQ